MSRTALIVGADGGIGRACCQALAADGYELLQLDRTRGHDATDPASVLSVVGSNPLSLVVHAAGSVGSGGIADGSVEDWRQVIEDNLISAMVVLQAVEPLLVDDAAVVLIGSVNGRHGGNMLSGPAYAAAKAGVAGLARNAAKELAGRGIRVNALAPGPVQTAMVDRLSADDQQQLRDSIPLDRFVQPDEIAGTVRWLGSPAARSITGAVIDINGGMWMG